MNANKPMRLQISRAGNTMQILLVSACSLVLTFNSVWCLNELSRPASVSYAQQYALSQTLRQLNQPLQQRVTDNRYNADSTSMITAQTSNLIQPAAQPSVYHSIIDRTDASNSGPGVSPAVQASKSTIGDLNTAAGHHHGHAHSKYYEYRSVPKKKTWKFGYKRGNHKHTISRHEHGKAGKHPQFKTKVKWHDKKSKGKGIHLWDYNHYDKKHYHHG